ncbi:MAG: MYXO-CTERM sorting domain-containing protein, partial [Myxococcales bacterium]|nr:MYXO-CTERM sorting domain-containing protein [Polyangiaceae bacterium]MDW8251123.1 MYXO-CTERM sorting domain-containing protein [Myxococcales bacterium]
GDTTLVDAYWPVISQKIGDALVALVDPTNGLIRKDSSIWETHWNGRERYWTYTSLTAARGLCDASKFAERLKDATRSKTYKDQAEALRKAIATKLTDKKRALASNLEELQSGDGYRDAAVFDAIAMELFNPKGVLAKATFADLDAHISVAAGAGWSRNDDRFDHAGKLDLSDWGSPYDSAEWVITNLRGAVAAQHGGDTARAKKLVDWTTNQSLANYLEVAETYDENTGVYKFNSPMLGFGAGAYILALASRTEPSDPACGAHFDESVLPPPQQGGGAGGSGQAGAGGSSGDAGQGGSDAGSGGSDAGSGGSGGGPGGAGGDAGQGGSDTGGTSPTGGAPSGGQAGSFGGIPESGGNTGKGGAAVDQGGVPGATTDEPLSEESCGCRVAGGSATSRRWGLLLGLATLLRRRRQ